MSSAAIMAIIQQKKAELASLQSTNSQVSEAHKSISCMASKLSQAGELINESGTIGGRSFDNGATLSNGHTFKKIASDTESVINEIKSKIASLEAEISSLYVQYQQALAREEAERQAALAAAAAAQKKKK